MQLRRDANGKNRGRFTYNSNLVYATLPFIFCTAKQTVGNDKEVFRKFVSFQRFVENDGRIVISSIWFSSRRACASACVRSVSICEHAWAFMCACARVFMRACVRANARASTCEVRSNLLSTVRKDICCLAVI